MDNMVGQRQDIETSPFEQNFGDGNAEEYHGDRRPTLQFAGFKLKVMIQIVVVFYDQFSQLDYYDLNHNLWLEILAPFIQTLQLLGQCGEIRLLHRNVPSLVIVVLRLGLYDEEDDDEGDNEGDHNLEKQFSNMKELLHSVAHVKNLELGPWLLECMSTPALEGWQFPPSSWKFLKLNTNLEELDFPGICSSLQSSSDIETLVMDWYSHDRREPLIHKEKFVLEL